ncbi:type II toxin-antitoxin system RelE/ParE family toxin [Treponema zuelzerae]|jgi:toxin ParE1/3/4|uniref:Type II toxin-antitoxin system RelE/ParE family toxin n=1 Tax=Teretinema zuelzerae TaxID=156 RepID=A0AAE3JK08_9SPIR|nr:type II toxin-antitoxin system RelE/ParE family toxin [Teretinema zuelzerae]MCD1656083.1 type II toxin-antitoxin system RelE/ParE family toxin [Teretinema zuelzerae]
MEYEVRIPNSVKRDIEEIIEYYFDDRPEYAKKIFELLFERINSLKSFPNKGRIVPELLEYNINEYREILESYWRIIYRIDNDMVEIFTVIDARRNVQDLLVEKLKRKFV